MLNNCKHSEIHLINHYVLIKYQNSTHYILLQTIIAIKSLTFYLESMSYIVDKSSYEK